MRINQYVASASGLSRRAADTAIASGHVTINGQPAKVGETVPPDALVCLDGRKLQPPAHKTYLMLNKPTGYVSSRRKQGSDPTIYQLLPVEYHALRPAGRLDLDSSGLMLLTNDGEFIQRHTHPSHRHLKRYQLHLDRPLSDMDIKKLQHGIKLTDGISKLDVVEHQDRHVSVQLSEGRNRQVRRTLGHLGYGIISLHRTHMGAYQLEELGLGEWRLLPAPEAA
jgi:23S rRNA pseudouridine2605 synthase